MSIPEQIERYFAAQPEAKCADMKSLHELISRIIPSCKLWFLDGKNDEGKTVSNPNVGYGSYNMEYAGGGKREFYQIGLSANTTGISVYVMGFDDRTYLSRTYGGQIGKASVTGYCVKFRKLNDVDIGVLERAMRDGLEATSRH